MPTPAPTPSPGAVFLSYAREDTDAARRVADALRAFGVEVWFDQNELRGGDSWDAKIKKQIRECALFLPIVSTHTQERTEGYFRREWLLAVERTRDMAQGVAFIVPVVIDETREGDATVPEEFMRYQWTRLAHGVPSPQFVEQVKRLLEAPQKTVGRDRLIPPSARGSEDVRGGVSDPAIQQKSGPPAALWISLGVVFACLGVVFFFLRPKSSAPLGVQSSALSVERSAAPVAADKSVAVLAFADLSEARNSEYFSDGISEELLNVLAKVPGLRVAARTSAFFFKGKNLPIPEIAAKLNVAYVVEGSVQRAGDRVKITAQLIKAGDGFHVWSDTFTRDLKDVFAVQEEIAGLIAKNLSLKLGASSAPAAAINPRALELFLRASESTRQRTKAGFEDAEARLKEVLALEPGFARAHAALADVMNLKWDGANLIGEFGQRHSPKLDEIRAEIDRALVLDPNLAEAHASLGNLYLEAWKFPEAAEALRRSIALNPNYASAHQWLARALMSDGRFDEALSEMQQAAVLDPLSHRIQDNLGMLLDMFGRPQEALAALDRALAIKPDSDQAMYFKAVFLDRLGRSAEAIVPARQAMAIDPANWGGGLFAVFVHAGRQAEAEAWPMPPGPVDPFTPVDRALALGKNSEAAALLNAEHYSWRSIGVLAAPLFDPIRADPRFRAFIDQLGITAAYARMQAWRAAHPLPPSARP